MKTRTKVIIAIVVVAGAVTAGRFSAPSKVVEKEKIVYQEKIVEKKVYVKDKSTKKNVVTVKITTIKPDGTKTIETRKYDTSLIEITQKGEINRVEDTTIVTEREKTTEFKKEDTLISFGIKQDFNNLVTGRSYGLFLNKRLLGPVYGGAFGFTDKSFGLNIGLSF